MTPIKQGYVVEEKLGPDSWVAISTPLDDLEEAIEFAKGPWCTGASYLRIALIYEISNSER